MKTRKIKHTKPSNKGTGFDKTLKSCGISILAALGIDAALLLLGTAAALATPDPLAFVEPVGYVTLFIGAFFGGFAAAKINKRAPLQTSLACGVAIILLSRLTSFALPHSLASGMGIWFRLGLHVLSLALFPVGAIVSIKASRPKKSKPRRKR